MGKLQEEVQAVLKKKHNSQKVIIDALFQNPLAWGMFYFKHHFRVVSPPFHLKIIKEYLSNRYLAIQAPRESAKSTVLNFLCTSHCIAFKRKHFIVIVQNTFAKSVGSLETIKKEFRENKKLMKDFKIKITKDAEGDSIFRHPDGFETRVLCKGAGQIGSVRGEKFGAYRPDLILGDDMEDDEMVRSLDRRRQFQEEFDDALLPAGDAHTCQYVFIGTILHDDCTISKLLSKDHYKGYRKLFYRARYTGPQSGEVKSLWAEKWTVERLNEMEQENPRKFAKEYQGDPTTGMMAKFDKANFRRWTIQNNSYVLFNDVGQIIGKGSLMDCRPAIACDLAWEEKRDSDFSVIMPGFLTPNSDLLVERYVCKKGLRPNEMEEIIFTMADRLEALTGKKPGVGFEKAKLEKVAKWFLKQAMKRRNTPLIFKTIEWGTDKIERITAKLEPRYHQHMIFHRDNMGDLEYQLLKFPYANHDDLCLQEGTKISTPFGDKNIEDFKRGDLVITPFGVRKVTNCGWTGMKETINLFGTKLTHNHKVFNKESSCFASADTIQYPYELSKLTYKEVIRWKYLRLLSLMEGNIEEWVGRESIIYLNRKVMKEGSVLKDFMWRFMRNIGELRWGKAFMFTILMATLLITTLITLSVSQLANITKDLRTLTGRLCSTALRKLKKHLRNGMPLLSVENGTYCMEREPGKIEHIMISNVKSAPVNLNQRSRQLNVAPKDVEIERKQLKNVYNLTVEDDGVYYANGTLVSNCDALQGLVQILQVSPKAKRNKEVSGDEGFDYLYNLVKKKTTKKPFVFGKKKGITELPYTDTFR